MADEKNKLNKLERLKERHKQISEQIKLEQNKRKSEERKKDTRRKILAGALALSHMEKDAEHKAKMERLLREGLTKSTDRELFGLSPLPEGKKKK